MQKSILILGGTSGVGLHLARHYIAAGHRVCVTGRRTPDLPGAQFHPLPVTADSAALARDLDTLTTAFPGVQTLIHAAGYLERGRIETQTDTALQTITNIGVLLPMMLAARLKPRAPTPLKLMLITSSSAYTPRPNEPSYATTKAAMTMLGASLARDPGIGKVLVAAPSGIATPFWDGTDEDTSTMLDPEWVAQRIVDLSSGPFKYRHARLLRNPARVEVDETLDNNFQPIA
jgi:NAD(P)-dependent dehydrogenase (short-subunit alcohol dehydrogenase family)